MANFPAIKLNGAAKTTTAVVRAVKTQAFQPSVIILPSVGQLHPRFLR